VNAIQANFITIMWVIRDFKVNGLSVTDLYLRLNFIRNEFTIGLIR